MRQSLALYYYNNGRPAEEISEGHTTIFRVRDGEEIEKQEKSEKFIKKLIPPIIFDLKNALLKK
ncbi:hypothetical protein [Gloeocapsa sp. PCC 73106]|uniref:hypothetical protein n=1 Tax=Gloeocapsa sp. PCC 73106 TaxID=102232 RepID=UPI0002ACDE14|nr:hypothetical protein [Gloeocapsa sp. PCC 73106]ELR99931.1 hypothetical protein GLO73106DRAFT_00037840 [Gloeocapsa sp. PCC 73106]